MTAQQGPIVSQMWYKVQCIAKHMNESTIIHFYLPIGYLLKMNNSWQTDPIAISPGPRAESSALNSPLLIGPLALHNAPFYGCVRSWIFGSEKSSRGSVYCLKKHLRLVIPLKFIHTTSFIPYEPRNSGMLLIGMHTRTCL